MTKVSLIATPIGNLADITLRALETLKSADVIAAEDTRHSRKLLSHYGIDKPLLRLDDHTLKERAPKLLETYTHIAYITDAGSPGISDPGADLVRLALSRQIEVEVLPGATAFVPALILSGLATQRFCFEGFLPRKGKERTHRLEHIAQNSATSIIYESPNRLLKTLEDLLFICGEHRQASISRELTKRFETTYRGSLKELIATLSQGEVKGEIVIVVSPVTEGSAAKPDYALQAQELALQGLSAKELRKALTELGLPRNEAYSLSLKAQSAKQT